MPRKKAVVTATNPRYARLKIPRGRGTFSSGQPTVEPMTALPKSRPSEVFKSSEHVKVTGSTKTQRPAGGNF